MTGDLVSECNETMMTLVGDTSFEDTIDLLVEAGTWTKLDKELAMSYSDGYKINIKQTMIKDVPVDKKSGICVGF